MPLGLIRLEWMVLNPGGRRESVKRCAPGGVAFIVADLFIAAGLALSELSLVLQRQKNLAAGDNQQDQAAVLVDRSVFYSHGFIVDNGHEKTISKPRANEI